MSAPCFRPALPSRHAAAFILTGWLLSAAAAGAADPVTRSRLLPLPDVRQHTIYACGAGALQAVLAYYGIDARQDVLMAQLGTNATIGTRWWEVVRVAQENGLEATPRTGMRVDDLRSHLDRGEPVLLALQAWANPPPASPADWALRTEDGHYVVAVGYDAERFYFEDPAMFGIGYIPQAELETRWHDYDEHGTRLERFGIAFRRAGGPEPLAGEIARIE